jgi:trehalose-phosphatase
MELLKPEGDLNVFFERLPKAQHRALLLDYDGTLASFHIHRDQAFPYPGVVEILDAIMEAGHTRLVLVSGRWTQDLIPLLRLKQMPEIWGSHGVERLMPDGKYTLLGLDDCYVAGLSQATAWIEEKGYQNRLERKPSSLAFHTRGLDDGSAAALLSEVRKVWEPMLQETGLSLHDFDGGIELRAHANKGIAVATIRSEMGEDAMMAYLGDDRTDEDAFEELGDKGLSVLVRPEFRETKAHLWMIPPEELLEFLTHWDTVCRNLS